MQDERVERRICRFPQVMVNIKATPEEKARYKEDEYIAGFIESQQQSLMGLGRVLVRVSGTEPLIRIMVEGKDEGGHRRQRRTHCSEDQRAHSLTVKRTAAGMQRRALPQNWTGGFYAGSGQLERL